MYGTPNVTVKSVGTHSKEKHLWYLDPDLAPAFYLRFNSGSGSGLLFISKMQFSSIRIRVLLLTSMRFGCSCDYFIVANFTGSGSRRVNSSVVDPDPHWYGSPGSGSVL